MKMRTGQDYIDEFVGMAEEEPDPLHLQGISEITHFYDDCNIFITGGSGFMGKLLIEKFLRCCPNMGQMFILIRGKKGKSIEERFEQHFEDSVYDVMRNDQPDFRKKITWIEGDTGASDLGISQSNRELLINKVHVVFHGAANVRFDQKLRQVVETNIRGTKLMLLLAKEMKNLKAFLHISTAFSHCPHKFIDEKYYLTKIDGDKTLDLMQLLDDDAIECITPMLLDKFPNTYTFSKAVAEETVRKYGSSIPTCIVRPSIVVSTSDEPIAGWINNFYGATGVVVGAGVGLLRTLHCEETFVADIIPADYVINNIVAAAWDTANTWEGKKPSEQVENLSKEPVIYNSVSSCQNAITWAEFMRLNADYGLQIPSTQSIWCYFFRLNRHLWIHNIFIFFFHLIPALIVDAACVLTRRKPMLLKAYQKIHKFSGVISYFCTQQWKFKNDNVLELWEKLNETDKVKYKFNVEKLDWNIYLQRHIRGLRLFLLKDPLTTIDEARVRYTKFRIAHCVLATLFCLFFTWTAFKLISHLIFLITV